MRANGARSGPTIPAARRSVAPGLLREKVGWFTRARRGGDAAGRPARLADERFQRFPRRAVQARSPVGSCTRRRSERLGNLVVFTSGETRSCTTWCGTSSAASVTSRPPAADRGRRPARAARPRLAAPTFRPTGFYLSAIEYDRRSPCQSSGPKSAPSAPMNAHRHASRSRHPRSGSGLPARGADAMGSCSTRQSTAVDPDAARTIVGASPSSRRSGIRESRCRAVRDIGARALDAPVPWRRDARVCDQFGVP